MKIDLLIYQALAGLGACSLQVSLPAAQALGLTAAPLASSVMTSSSAYANFNRQICQANLIKAAQQYRELGIKPRALLVGYVPCVELYSEIYSFKEIFPDCFLALDPVLGDNAHMYSNMSQDLVIAIRKLSKLADLLTPNLTEALLLAKQPLETYEHFNLLTEEKAKKAATDLYRAMDLDAKTLLVIKGWAIKRDLLTKVKQGCNYLFQSHKIYNAIFDWHCFANTTLEYSQFSGTGDLFAATLLSLGLKGQSWPKALEQATEIAGNSVDISVRKLLTIQEQLKTKLSAELIDKELSQVHKQGLAMPEVLQFLVNYRKSKVE